MNHMTKLVLTIITTYGSFPEHFNTLKENQSLTEDNIKDEFVSCFYDALNWESDLGLKVFFKGFLDTDDMVDFSPVQWDKVKDHAFFH